jgi:hypothetical protein
MSTSTRTPRRAARIAYYRGRPVIIWQTALSRPRRSVEVDRA